MPRSLQLIFNDVLRYGATAERLASGKTYLAYANDERLRLSLERCLSVICEALYQSIRQRPDLMLYIDDVEQAIALRHRLVHGYYSIADQVCWSVVVDDLPGLMQRVTELSAAGLLAEQQEESNE